MGAKPLLLVCCLEGGKQVVRVVPGLNLGGSLHLGILLSSNHALSPYVITLGAPFLQFLPVKICAAAGPIEREKEKENRREGKSI